MPVINGVIWVKCDTQFCGWCGCVIVDGDEHGIVTVADDGGATVTCRVAMICDTPAACGRIEGIA